MKFEDLKDLLQIFKDSGLTYMEYEQDGIRVTFDSKKMPNAPLPPMPVQPQAVLPQAAEAQAPAEDTNKYVTSPLVGTFHCASTPNGKPFVTEGSKVNKGDKLCIIEAMKVMNEITAKEAGTIKKVLVSDNQMVEYGQKLFIIGD